MRLLAAVSELGLPFTRRSKESKPRGKVNGRDIVEARGRNHATNRVTAREPALSAPQ